MANIADLIANRNQELEDFKQKKQEERTEAYERRDAAVMEVTSDPEKYRAFLELRELDSDITAEELQNMSMREIWDMIEELSGNESDSFSGAGGKHRQTDQDRQGRNEGKQN